MRISTFLNKILRMRGVLARGICFKKDGLELEVAPRHRVPRCSVCGKKVRAVHSSRVRRWRHLGMCGQRLYLRYQLKKLRCPRCGIKVERVPWARPGRTGFTTAFEDAVAWMLQKTDQTAACRYFGISWETAGRIARRVLDERLGEDRFDNLVFIGVDEISYRRQHRYLTIVVDHMTGRLVWAGEGKSKATLNAFFDQLGRERTAALHAVSMDLSSAYIEVVQDRAPEAEIVADRFHLEKLVRDAVDEVRREEMRTLPDDEKRRLRRSRWPLLKNPWNLRRQERAKLRDIEKSNRRIYRAYLLKEQFLSLFEYRSPGWAKRMFKVWYQWARRSRLTPFKRVAKTMHTHFDKLLGFIRQGLSNGRVEGMNNKLRLISHRAFGFHSASAFIGMAYLCCSGIPMDLCTQA